MYALIDCNNFFVSCERVFEPRLEGKPVVVLSNNDGCIISRSNEAKAVGIPMGAPLHEWQEVIKKHAVRVFSCNFTLYGDLSSRVMSIVRETFQDVEVYSIDEAFMRCPSDLELTEKITRKLRANVLQWTGIPISIGIGETKVLAKVANRIAKKEPHHGGVFLLRKEQRDAVLQTISVGDIWGIGWKTTPFLKCKGIGTAFQLKEMPDGWVKKNLSITGLRLVWELRGKPCLELGDQTEGQKGILSSRSFGVPITELADLKEAVAHHVTRAAEKLRKQGSAASHLQVFIRTNRFSATDKQYGSCEQTTLPEPTAYTPTLISQAHRLLATMFRAGYRYKKAGVMLSGFVPESQVQLNLLEDSPDHGRQQRLMQVMDTANALWGSESIRSGALGQRDTWRMKQVHRSPRYTTRWEEVLKVS
ncbi:MAG: Y-family DNA polymerase [bacterium]